MGEYQGLKRKPQTFELNVNGVWDGDKQRGLAPYVFSDEIAIAVDVAFVTNRPLLISGPPGSGKSVLAPTMAAIHGWDYLSHTFTSRTRLEDLTGEIDQLRRLNDAQAVREGQALPPKSAYLEPGILWWAFQPRTAVNRNASKQELSGFEKRYGQPFEHARSPQGRTEGDVVLLFDEIDKAEPDIPNDLLEPLDERRFSVPHGEPVVAPSNRNVFVVVTTNRERELPPAFHRRCISLELQEPDQQRLEAIARQHFLKGGAKLHAALAARVIELGKQARRLDIKPPSTSEYLDAIRACRKLKISPNDGDEVWEQLIKATLLKETADTELEQADDEAW